ncbi:MAG: DEAD/DEAH box helicase family protein [Bacteroidales bacterium]|nr:DEAD/DEAH box helicase family protein [Bacteroidales bacterium]MDD4671073.1 DEAD/DEAH box helicase family protein [Bacteroidales bacterium]
MIKEIQYQKKAVDELIDKTIGLLNSPSDRKKLIFKAPTGSGKTVMASELLSRLVLELPNRGDCKYSEVAIIWIAPNKLHQQSYLRMKSYFTESRELHPVMYDELDHSIDGYIKPGEIFFVNWESINKDNAVMIRETEQSASLYDIVRRTKEKEIPVIVVIDEEHMFGGRNAPKSEKVLRTINPKLEIRISATPITSGDQMVAINREDVIAEEMIKEGIVLNPAISSGSDAASLNQRLMKMALAQRASIKKAYEALEVNINPLLLIQLPNDSSEAMSTEDNTIAEEVKQYLKAVCDITPENGKLAIWLSSQKENLANLDKPDNLVEVLLFKQAIALGWDCQRAAVLLIFRKIESTVFTTQTVGRILRMPEQKFYPADILNKGYVFTNLSREKIEFVADEMNYMSNITCHRRSGITNVELPSVYQEYTSAERNRLGPDFKVTLRQVFDDNWLKLPIQLSLFSPFETEEKSAEPAGVIFEKAENRKKAESLGINFNVKNITVEIPEDVVFRGDETVIDVKGKRVRIARTVEEVDRVYKIYCRSLLNSFEKTHSTNVFAGYLVEYLEYAFDIFETDAKKVVLYYLNKPKFTEVLTLALARYKKILSDRQEKIKAGSYKQYTWEIPEDRIYNETSHNILEDVGYHALLPYARLKTSSSPEISFEKFLEENGRYIEWWYKNGDEGKQHYAVSYTKKDGTSGLFYVDYVIKMRSGHTFLFDTKTEESDENAPQKHNALLDYMQKEENKPLGLKGGVIICDHEVWKYCPFKIYNTIVSEGWVAFFPDRN